MKGEVAPEPRKMKGYNEEEEIMSLIAQSTGRQKVKLADVSAWKDQ